MDDGVVSRGEKLWDEISEEAMVEWDLWVVGFQVDWFLVGLNNGAVAFALFLGCASRLAVF